MVNYQVVNETVQYFQSALEQAGLHLDAKRLWGEVQCAPSARAVLETITTMQVPMHLLGRKKLVTAVLEAVV